MTHTHDRSRYGNFLPNDNNRRFHQLLDSFLLLVGNTWRKGRIYKSILQYPPEHYKPCFRLKQRALQRALTALYIIVHLLDKISKHFNYNLTLLGTTAAAWVKRLNRLYSVICSYFSFVEVLLFVVNHIEC